MSGPKCSSPSHFVILIVAMSSLLNKHASILFWRLELTVFIVFVGAYYCYYYLINKPWVRVHLHE